MPCKRCRTEARLDDWTEFRCLDCDEFFCSNCNEVAHIAHLEDIRCPSCGSDRITIAHSAIKKDSQKIMMKKGWLS